MNLALQVVPSGVAITEGATSYQQLRPSWDLFSALVRYLCLYLDTLDRSRFLSWENLLIGGNFPFVLRTNCMKTGKN